MIKNRSPYSWLFSLSGYLLAHLYSPLMDALWVYLCWHNPTCSLLAGVSPLWACCNFLIIQCVFHGLVLEI